MIQDEIDRWGHVQKLYAMEATYSLVKEVGNLKQLRSFGIQKLTNKKGKIYACPLEIGLRTRRDGVAASCREARSDQVYHLKTLSQAMRGNSFARRNSEILVEIVRQS